VRVIRKGDTAFISPTVDIPKYRHSPAGWGPFKGECLGKSGKVIGIIKLPGEGCVVGIRIGEEWPNSIAGKVSYWLLRDISLHPFSKWRRQDLGGEK